MMHLTRMILFSLVCSASARAVTINGQDINEVLQPNQVLVYDNTDSQSISLSADTKGNVTIGSIRLTAECERHVSSYYTQLELAQERMAQKRGKQVCFRSADSQYYEGAYIEGAEGIALSAGTSLAFSNSILRSSDVYLEAPSMAFVDTYVDADTLTLASTTPDALIESISIFFERESGIAPLVIGAIDFKANEIMGSIQQGMSIVGVRKVVISFAHLAFYQENQESDVQDDGALDEVEPACDQEAQEFQNDDAQGLKQADDIAPAQPNESQMLVEEAVDESDLLAEMANQEREVQAMQEREAHAQEKQILENAQEDAVRVVASTYAQELPMDSVSRALDQEDRCAACSAGKDDTPPVTKLEEHEALPEAKINEAELSAPAYTPIMRTCCMADECALIQEQEQELTAAEPQKRWLAALKSPLGIVVGALAAGVVGKYAYNRLFTSARTA